MASCTELSVQEIFQHFLTVLMAIQYYEGALCILANTMLYFCMTGSITLKKISYNPYTVTEIGTYYSTDTDLGNDRNKAMRMDVSGK